MILYHGTNIKFTKPDVNKGKLYRDFGPGFYLAENYYDALGMARKRTGEGYLYTYEINDSILEKFKILTFNNYDYKWAEFIFNNRMNNIKNDYDIIIGPMAGNNVNNLIKQYNKEEKKFNDIKKDFLNNIKDTTLGIQWNIINQNIIDYLKELDCEFFNKEDFC